MSIFDQRGQKVVNQVTDNSETLISKSADYILLKDALKEIQRMRKWMESIHTTEDLCNLRGLPGDYVNLYKMYLFEKDE